MQGRWASSMARLLGGSASVAADRVPKASRLVTLAANV